METVHKVAFLALLSFALIVKALYAVAQSSSPCSLLCKGQAECFEGIVKDIVDGDTMMIGDETVRLSLVNTPEKGDGRYQSAIDFLWSVCPVGSNAVVDEDDLQTSRSHRRLLAVVYCEFGDRYINLNEVLLEQGQAVILEDFCDRSEFRKENWATSHGCP